MSKSQTLVEVPSGKIELVIIDQLPVLQFNCSCEDALPYCNAVCCRRRPDYNMALEGEDEIKRFAGSSIRHPTVPSIHLMAYKDGACIHLDGCKCAVHEEKPSICRRWHCSPGGVGEGIEVRDNGFSFVPFNGDLQHEMIHEHECEIDPCSSRVCERGTKSCIINHKNEE